MMLTYFPPIHFLFHYYRWSGSTSLCIWSFHIRGLHSAHCNCMHHSKYHKYQLAHFMTMRYKQWPSLTCTPDYAAPDEQVFGSVHSWMFSKAGRCIGVLEPEQHSPSLWNIMITHKLQVFISNLNQPQWTVITNTLWLIIFIQKP